MKTLSATLCVVFLSFGLITAQDRDMKTSTISVGDEIIETLKAETEHHYKIFLESDHYIYGRVDQISVDVVVTIKNPAGEVAAQFDGPSRGWEHFQLITKEAGDYSIEITPFEQEEGDYKIRLEKAEAAAQDPEGKIDQLMTAYSGEVPGVAILIRREGDIVLEKYYGLANLSYKVKMNPSTLHNVGSTSKHFLTFGLLLLEEQGKLSLDDNVREYIPELPQFEHPVTLRHLVNHTSGYREFLNLIAMTGRNISTPLSQEKVIEMVRRQPELQNVPGAEFNYNNTGYVLATEVIERITGLSYPAWMKENVFEPLNMNHTMVRSDPNQIVEMRSVGYRNGDEGVEEVTDLGGGMGPGAIYSTMGDLATWAAHLLDPKPEYEAMVKEMMATNKLNNGDDTGYGMGLFVQDYKGLKYVHHGGADMAHRSNFMLFPEIDAAVIVQSNFAGFDGSLATKSVDLFFEEHLTDKDDPDAKEESEEEGEFIYDAADFDALTGRYELSIMPGFVLTFSRDGDRIYTQATGQPEVDIRATSDSTFSLIGVNASITFHRNEDGSADSLTLHQNGNHIARKIDFELTEEQMKEYTGRYFSEEIETIYTIVIEDGDLIMENYQIEDGLKLTPGNVDSFGAEFPIAEVSFERNEAGEIIGFKASNGRTRGVYFKKWKE